MRQIVLDTETTGLDIQLGHRIIEIGCVEIIDRKITKRYFHKYVNPLRDIDQGALDVHGLTTEFLSDKPIFGSILEAFLEFIGDSELIIHNADFDLAFLDNEIKIVQSKSESLRDKLPVIDSLELARAKHPGQKNSLDALCKRYGVDNSSRDFHGALLDAKILADVYLLLTGGQTSFDLEKSEVTKDVLANKNNKGDAPVIKANEVELREHREFCEKINETSSGRCIWNISKF